MSDPIELTCKQALSMLENDARAMAKKLGIRTAKRDELLSFTKPNQISCFSSVASVSVVSVLLDLKNISLS